MKTYVQFINEDYRDNQKKLANESNSEYCVYYINKDTNNLWSNTQLDLLDMFSRKFFYKKVPALLYLKDVSNTHTNEAFLSRKDKQSNSYHPNYDFYLEKWWVNPNNGKPFYWDEKAFNDPHIYSKYLLGYENVGKLISLHSFKEIDPVKEKLLSNEKYKHIWDEIVKYCPKLDTGAEMGELGF